MTFAKAGSLLEALNVKSQIPIATAVPPTANPIPPTTVETPAPAAAPPAAASMAAARSWSASFSLSFMVCTHNFNLDIFEYKIVQAFYVSA
jgi:hypothetical protein